MSELDNRMHRVSNLRSERASREWTRKKLLKAVSKKARNIFIGSLVILEEHLGQLWGIGLPEEDCTQNQLAWREKWEQLRTDILNSGNAELRAIEKEMSEYDFLLRLFRSKDDSQV